MRPRRPGRNLPLGGMVSVLFHAALLGVVFLGVPPDRELGGRRAAMRIHLRTAAPQAELASPAAASPAPALGTPPPEQEAPPEQAPPEQAPPEQAPPEETPPPEPQVTEPPPERKKRRRRPRRAPREQPEEVAEAPETPEPPAAPEAKPAPFTYEIPDGGAGGSVPVPSGAEGDGSRFGAIDGEEGGTIGLPRGTGRRSGKMGSGATDEVENPVPPARSVDREPRLVSRPSVSSLRRLYPEAARRDGVEAVVKMRLLIDREGRVKQVKVLSAVGYGFGDAARRIAKMLRYRPARRGGRTVQRWVTLRLPFRLDD